MSSAVLRPSADDTRMVHAATAGGVVGAQEVASGDYTLNQTAGYRLCTTGHIPLFVPAIVTAGLQRFKQRTVKKTALSSFRRRTQEVSDAAASRTRDTVYHRV